MLIIGVIVAVVVLTQNASNKATPSIETQTPTTNNTAAAPSDVFLAQLKPLLSNESLKALDDPKSTQSQSLVTMVGELKFSRLRF